MRSGLATSRAALIVSTGMNYFQGHEDAQDRLSGKNSVIENTAPKKL